MDTLAAALAKANQAASGLQTAKWGEAPTAAAEVVAAAPLSRLFKAEIAVLGDAFVDIVAAGLKQEPSFKADIVCPEPPGIVMLAGGSGLNTATQLSSLRPDTGCALHSILGKDHFAKFLREHATEHGITLHAPSIDKPTGVCIVLSGGEKDRGFVWHRGAVGAFAREHVDEAALCKAAHVHVAGYYNCSALQASLPEMLRKAKAAGLTTSLDPQHDAEGKWTHVEAVLPYIDVFLPNEAEAMAISEASTVDEALEWFKSRVPLTVLTVGTDGAVAVDGKGLVKRQTPPPCNQVVDATGAGDSFNAGFIHGWLKDGVDEGLLWGCCCGTSAVGKVGASTPTDLQTVQDMVQQLRGNKKRKVE